MYKHSTVVNNTLYVDGIDRLDLARSCACGQSFRWHEDNGGFTAPALGRVVHARQAGDTLSIYPCAEGEFPKVKETDIPTTKTHAYKSFC